MDEEIVSKKATDNGPVTIDGQTAEWWHAKGSVIVLENHDDWYFGQNGTVLTITGTGFGASVTPGLGADYGQV